MTPEKGFAAAPDTQIAQRAGVMDRVPPWVLVVIAVTSVQIGAAFAKQLFEVAGPSGVVFLRTFLATVMFLVAWRPKLWGHPTKVYLYALLYAITLTANMLLFYAAINLIPLGVAVAIAFAGPLMLAVAGSRRLLDLVWVVLAGAGIILLSPFANEQLNATGVIIALLTAVAWAAYIILTKRVGGILEGNTMLALAMPIAALITAPFGLSGALNVLAAPNLILISLVVAFFSVTIPFSFEFIAMKRLTPRVFGLLVSLEPVMATVIGFIVLHETLGEREVIGIALVTVAAAATTRAE
ncbi:MAG: EamA family transporter [Anaerolineae bacterium]|nr:EamA family transporter [Anaerolineae bacterium]